MAKIVRLSYCTVAVPLSQPIAFATAAVSVRCFALLKLKDTDGAQGIAYAYLGPQPVRIVSTALEELLVPIVVGKPSSSPERIWDDMNAATRLHGRAGAVLRAMSLVDIALWDLNARRNAVPLYRQLGASPVEAVMAYAAGGYYGPDKGIPELVSELQDLRNLGFRALKMKTGKLSPEDESARVGAVRAAIGPETDLMLDANNAWPDVETALRYLRSLEGMEPYWIEEPFPNDDTDLLKNLRTTVGIRVATGESEANPSRFKDFIRANAVDVVQPDAMVCGGITPWMRIARTACDHSVVVCPHAFHNLHAHLLAAVSDRGLLEFMPGDRVMNFGRLITEDLSHKGGQVLLPQGPGLGFDFVEAEVRKYAVKSAGESKDWVEWG